MHAKHRFIVSSYGWLLMYSSASIWVLNVCSLAFLFPIVMMYSSFSELVALTVKRSFQLSPTIQSKLMNVGTVVGTTSGTTNVVIWYGTTDVDSLTQTDYLSEDMLVIDRVTFADCFELVGASSSEGKLVDVGRF